MISEKGIDFRLPNDQLLSQALLEKSSDSNLKSESQKQPVSDVNEQKNLEPVNKEKVETVEKIKTVAQSGKQIKSLP